MTPYKCDNPNEAIEVVSNHLYFFGDGFYVPREVGDCLLKLKYALLFIALETQHMLDVQLSNFVIACGAAYCKVPNVIMEILRYMRIRLGG